MDEWGGGKGERGSPDLTMGRGRKGRCRGKPKEQTQTEEERKKGVNTLYLVMVTWVLPS